MFGELSFSDSKCPHALSKIYGILPSCAFSKRPFYIRYWERELGKNLTRGIG